MAAGRLQRGSALILSLVIAAVLALLATAFLITVRVERQAAVNTLRGAQAEAACQAGLAAAIYRLELSADLYAADAGHLPDWHRHFYSATGPNLCPDSWVAHYDASFVDAGMTAQEFDLPITTPWETLKSQKGFRARYYVAVADLDGKLHSNPAHIANLLDAAGTDTMLGTLGLSPAAVTALGTDDNPHRSLGDLRARLVAGTPASEWNDGEKFFTVYPRVTAPDPLVPGSISLANSRMNVNTARTEALTAILSQIPSLAAAGTHTAGNLAAYLAARRPFANRSELENAIYDISLAGAYAGPVAPWGTGERLSETEFNDILNSLNAQEPSIYASDGNRASVTAGASGVYEYDFTGAKNTGGAKTSDQPTASWGTEVKFTSRFFHIYTLGRTVAQDGSGRVTAERRMHAVYDADAHKVLWLRWNFGTRANMTDP